MSDITKERWTYDRGARGIYDADGCLIATPSQDSMELGFEKAIAVLPEALDLLHRYVRGEASRSEAWDILDRAGVLK